MSIVTPSLNAAQFIEETIGSVLSQDYPNIEYIVMDGGSTDGTVAILEKYRGRLQYMSEPDQGTADAVNRGFGRSQGEIFAWLSADDTYLPCAVSTAVACFRSQPAAAVVYGEGYWTDEKGGILSRYPTRTPYDPTMFARECSLCQPACFIRRDAFAAAGMLKTPLHSAFDYDLWIRMSRLHSFAAVPEYLATSRMHKQNKSLGARRVMFEESISLLRSHYGYVPLNWVYAYQCFLRNGHDQFFQPIRWSTPAFLASLRTGSSYNQRRLLSFWAEWAGFLAEAARQYLAR